MQSCGIKTKKATPFKIVNNKLDCNNNWIHVLTFWDNVIPQRKEHCNHMCFRELNLCSMLDGAHAKPT